jgi:transposase
VSDPSRPAGAGPRRRLTLADRQTGQGILARVRPRDDVGRLRKKLATAQIADLVAIDKRLAEINQELKAAVAKTSSGLTRLYGVGPVTTARVLGEVGDVSRFRSRHHFASYNGTARPTRAAAVHPHHA